MNKKLHVLDGIVEAVDMLLEDLGYEHARMSQLESVGTTQYEGIVFRDGDIEYTIGFDLSETYNRKNDTFEKTNYLDELTR